MTRAKLRLSILGGVLLVLTACSLIVDTNGDQCTSDADCAGFSRSVCTSGVCSITPGGGLGPDGAPLGADGSSSCKPKVPESQSDFLNEPCTGSQCFPFDDCERIGICDGGLPALAAPPDGGV